MSELLALVLSAVWFYALPDLMGLIDCWKQTWYDWGDDLGVCYTPERCLRLYPISMIGPASRFCNETFYSMDPNVLNKLL